MIRNFYKSRYFPELKALMCHEKEVEQYIRNAVRLRDPEIIIELGTGTGGFTLLLHECNENILLYSFDNNSIYESKKIRGLVTSEDITELVEKGFNSNVVFIVDNILNKKNELLVSLLSNPRRKFLYCDNGDKGKEIIMYAEYLKSGDMLGVHDWETEVFNNYADEVRKILFGFYAHEFNSVFRRLKLRTRLFIKK